jgi:hypothetical protein
MSSDLLGSSRSQIRGFGVRQYYASKNKYGEEREEEEEKDVENDGDT